MSSHPFLLRKWYLDCVSDEGDAAIVYSAELQWRGFSLHYSSLLASRAHQIATRTSWKGAGAPTSDENTLALDLPQLGLTGIWVRDCPSVARTIYQNDDGQVRWDCLQPRSRVKVRISDHGDLNGLGYAEQMTLTIPPWKLPIDSLIWGRYVCASDSVTWIEWKGTYSTSFAIHNGLEHSVHCENSHVTVGDVGTISFGDSLTLRDGALADTVLRNIPLIDKILPPSIFNLREHKWCSRANFNCNDRVTSGWAIHEVAQWK